MKFHCWLKDHHGEEDGREVDAFDAQDAAGDACQEWSDGGTFAGDPIPDEIEVYVRNVETRELFMVDVEPQYNVSFYGGPPKPAAEPE